MHPAFLMIHMHFIEIEAPSSSPEQDKAVSEHSIPLGKHNTFYYKNNSVSK